MIGTPLNLEILLHCYYSSAPHPRIDAPAVMEGIDYLCASGMIDPRPNGTWGTTEKAEVYIEYVLKVPFPESKWTIPSQPQTETPQ